MRQREQNNRGKTSENQRLQVPLLYAFREAAAAGDSRKADLRHDADGARILSQRASLRQRGANEAALKRNLNIDLDHLANTINLASVVDLEAYPAVRRSVLNFGIDDLTHLTVDSNDVLALGEALRAALIAHEPRLVPETLRVERRETDEDNAQRIGFHAHAEMKCRPVDIPLEFVAEIDVGSGKVELHGVADAGAAPRPAPAAGAKENTDRNRAGLPARG
ncbi:MAG: type VI secretion system baseplate subunit TssE [Roseovarius sp.]|nr:type VI secretion system baseplate subunit TssE [Roseovarius sp.]MBK45152.1 type VI secretion system baseplate subunit TssE [Roseovarius sp.]|tara:strand:+ start:319 stop:981 length:663 start_codon:yes stop_codon:yes gene_type:complete